MTQELGARLASFRLRKKSARQPVSSEERLVICLRYLATGASFRQLSFDFFMAESTVARIVHETCAALATVLKPVYLNTPTTAVEWLAIAKGFWEQWQLPNALGPFDKVRSQCHFALSGAIDGKHVKIRAPPNSGSVYFNYKKGFSTVMMAVSDAQHRVVYVSVGSFGRESDGGIFDRSDFAAALRGVENKLDLPGPSPLPGTDVSMPHYFIGDAAFGLKEYLMRPFGDAGMTRERRIFNYRSFSNAHKLPRTDEFRLCRGRRVVESCFGILCARWRLLLKPIETSVENSDNIVTAICCLHNYLIDEGQAFTGGADLDDSEDPTVSLPQAMMRAPQANHSRVAAEQARQKLVDFFNGAGAVEWQEEYAGLVP